MAPRFSTDFLSYGPRAHTGGGHSPEGAAATDRVRRPSPSRHLGQLTGERAERDPPVADPVLLLRGHLRRGDAVALWDEHRVVPETVFAPPLTQQAATQHTLSDHLGPVRHDEH